MYQVRGVDRRCGAEGGWGGTSRSGGTVAFVAPSEISHLKNVLDGQDGSQLVVACEVEVDGLDWASSGVSSRMLPGVVEISARGRQTCSTELRKEQPPLGTEGGGEKTEGNLQNLHSHCGKLRQLCIWAACFFNELTTASHFAGHTQWLWTQNIASSLEIAWETSAAQTHPSTPPAEQSTPCLVSTTDFRYPRHHSEGNFQPPQPGEPTSSHPTSNVSTFPPSSCPP